MSSRVWILLALLGAMSLSPSMVRAEERADAESSGEKSDARSADEPSAKARPKGRSLSSRAAARRAEREAAARQRNQKDRTQWLARLQVRGVEPWPDSESDEVHAAALAESRQMSDEVISVIPDAKLYETEHFL